MGLKRRQMLQCLVATSALLFAAPAHAAGPPRRLWTDPEPLQHFAGFAEGFYWAGAHVYYIDEHAMGWAPPNLDRARLISVALADSDPASVLSALRKRHWAWTVEHAVLLRLRSNPGMARDLLAAAIALDRATPRPSAARLHHLDAALDAARFRQWRSTHSNGRVFATALVSA